jgi:hypothetical protein
MRPLTDLLVRLLVGLLAQVDAGLDVAHLSHRDLRDSVRSAEGDDLACRLMQQVPLLTIHPGAHLGFPPQQPFGTA